jgi:hypothetical protein
MCYKQRNWAIYNFTISIEMHSNPVFDAAINRNNLLGQSEKATPLIVKQYLNRQPCLEIAFKYRFLAMNCLLKL